jgi:hypothetical protein
MTEDGRFSFFETMKRDMDVPAYVLVANVLSIMT